LRVLEELSKRSFPRKISGKKADRRIKGANSRLSITAFPAASKIQSTVRAKSGENERKRKSSVKKEAKIVLS